jgi:arginase
MPLDLVAMDRGLVRRLGIDSAIAESVAHLTREGGPRGFWIHVDVDVLEQSIMFAVDDPQPDGLSWAELQTALRMTVASNGAVGLQITLYNPDGRRRRKRARPCCRACRSTQQSARLLRASTGEPYGFRG